MGNLSKNFSSWEFQCPTSGISNPDPSLIEGLQELRDLAGVSIKITSGGRTGTAKEQAFHRVSESIQSKAADVILMGLTLLEAYRYALKISRFLSGGIGIYPNSGNVNSGFLHLDVRDYFARWSRLEGVYTKHQEGLDYITKELRNEGVNVVIDIVKQAAGISYKVPRVV